MHSRLIQLQEDQEHSEGYWAEFFLLKPDRKTLNARLEALTADDLLHFQDEGQQLFLHAVNSIKAGRAPSDEVALEVSPRCSEFAIPETYSSDIDSVPSSSAVETLHESQLRHNHRLDWPGPG